MDVIRLWRDVPEDERVDRAYYLLFSKFYINSKRGKSIDVGKLNSVLELHERPMCQAAVIAYDSGNRWKPCGARPLAGESFCSRHGGPKRDSRLVRLKKRHDKAYNSWRRRVDQADAIKRELDWLKREIDVRTSSAGSGR